MPVSKTLDPRFSDRMVGNVPHCGWQPTGISVNPGQFLSIRAKGICSGSPGYPLGPGGTRHVANPANLAPGLPAMSLIGKIGAGAPFFIGEVLDTPVTTSGALYLGYNDNKSTDNSGSFSVTIDFAPPAPLSLAGTWNEYTDKWGYATWKITKLPDGRYQAQQFGLLNVTGFASVVGYQMGIQWTTPNKSSVGSYSFVINSTWTACNGYLVVRGGKSQGIWNSTLRKA